MAKIQPWTHSKLDDFINCPRAFHQKSVLKRFPFQSTKETEYGNRVHKDFELRIAEGKKLPFDLKHHEPYMQALEDMPGEVYAEREIALDKKGKPCSWFHADVWHRGKIDYTNINDTCAKIVDYKTGKKREKFKQLIANSIWVFIQYPEVEKVDVCFYWTQDQSESKATYLRSQIPALWNQLIPDLKQYRDAFKTDTWQPRQSGLCRGWCPVNDCEFWSEKPPGR